MHPPALWRLSALFLTALVGGGVLLAANWLMRLEMRVLPFLFSHSFILAMLGGAASMPLLIRAIRRYRSVRVPQDSEAAKPRLPLGRGTEQS